MFPWTFSAHRLQPIQQVYKYLSPFCYIHFCFTYMELLPFHEPCLIFRLPHFCPFINSLLFADTITNWTLNRQNWELNGLNTTSMLLHHTSTYVFHHCVLLLFFFFTEELHFLLHCLYVFKKVVCSDVTIPCLNISQTQAQFFSSNARITVNNCLIPYWGQVKLGQWDKVGGRK